MRIPMFNMRNIMSSLRFPAAVILTAVLLFSCSGGGEDEAENKQDIESQTAEIGHQAAQTIKEPMENAQDTVDRENERMREYEKRLNE